jgi:hypothetical protein
VQRAGRPWMAARVGCAANLSVVDGDGAAPMREIEEAPCAR